MASLIPCSSCRRHLHRHTAQCPFCGAQQPAPSAPRRPLVIPRDASRATLFALGLALVGQGCGGQTEDNHQNGSAGSQGTMSSARQGGGEPGQTPYTCADNPLLAGCARGSTQDTCANNPLLPGCGPTTPPYGASFIPPPGTAGAPGQGGTSDAGSLDAGAKDAGSGDAGGRDAAPDKDAGN